MKRSAILLLALALCLAWGCGPSAGTVIQLTEPAEGFSYATYAGARSTATTKSFDSTVFPTESSKISATSTTQPPDITTSLITKTSKSAKPTTEVTKTTTKPATEASGNAALAAFQAAIDNVLKTRAGFNKTHKIYYNNWTYDGDLTDSLNILPFIDSKAYMTDALNTALSNGLRTSAQQKGKSTQLLKESRFTMADLQSVTESSANGARTITLLVKDGETRQQKKQFGSGATGNSPIDKGPLYHSAIEEIEVYDHLNAEQIFAIVKDNLGAVSADPIDVTESTSRVKFVAKLDSTGALQSLQVTYHQLINLKEINILMTSYKDNKGSSAVTIEFNQFKY
jgi:hypothetical protein